MEKKFTDSLRGYAFKIMQRDNFICQYCGLDGQRSFDNWLALSWDHLLPKGYLNRNNPDYIVAACNFCNTADNRYFDKEIKKGFDFSTLTPKELIKKRKKAVDSTRRNYKKFWIEKVTSNQ